MKDFFIDHVERAHITRTDVVGSEIWVGVAALGVPESEPRWSIKKITTTNPIKTEWASGNANFDKSWENRTSYSYS